MQKITNVEQLANFDISEIKTLLAIELYKYSEYLPELRAQATFEIVAKAVCPDHYCTENFEIALRKQNNQIYEDMLQSQTLAFLYDQYEFEF